MGVFILSKKGWLKAFSVFTGTLIGAGFAGGKETVTYFVDNGKVSILSFIISFAIFFLSAVICTQAAEKMRNNSDFYNLIFGNKAAVIFESATTAFIFVLFCAMISAATEVFYIFLGINKDIIRFGFILTCFSVIIFGANGIAKMNSVIVPFLMLGMIICLLSLTGKYDMPEISFLGKIKLPVAFSFYNMSTCIPVLIACRKEFGRNERNTGFFVGALFISILNMTLACVLAENNACKSQIPMFTAMRENGMIHLYSAVFISAVFTTACANGCVLYKRNGNIRHDIFLAVFFIMLSFMVSHISFSFFVEKVYSIFCVLGIAITVFSFRLLFFGSSSQNK
jgi:uncharacterized membrane protein YkvI